MKNFIKLILAIALIEIANETHTTSISNKKKKKKRHLSDFNRTQTGEW